ncbi:hypothetical protein BDD43_6041 [Mucilaginibacter gracilis]|uniref:VWFA domain-containing protein n=1 Tax=Mucilaginibacter gracilis TaxID=423350 RepID=A0A495J9Q9_9SPHI|nr:hypothetical protein [Mucilaginibacter gracilis]RKR85766.1 hypothetical protein BDD43_6041 [Mucilaginibacter gracilis]
MVNQRLMIRKLQGSSLTLISHYLPIVLVSCILCSGCSLSEKKRRVITVLLDYSASSSEKVLDNYINVVDKDIFASMGPNDCLTVMPIDQASVREPVKLVYEDLTGIKFNRKNDGFAHAQDSIQTRIAAYIKNKQPVIESTLRDQRIKRRDYLYYTDILGALRQTDNMLEVTPQISQWEECKNFVIGRTHYTSENVIVILSDMIQDTPECSFNSRAALNYRQAGKYLQELKSSNKMPDLKKCKVFIIGATGRNAVQIDNIRSFWQTYFQMSNADLQAYGYNVEDKLTKYLASNDN